MQPQQGVNTSCIRLTDAAHTSLSSSWTADETRACGALLRTALCCFQTLTSVLAGLLLPYPTANLVLDVAMLFLYLGIEIIRLFFGECLSKEYFHSF